MRSRYESEQSLTQKGCGTIGFPLLFQCTRLLKQKPVGHPLIPCHRQCGSERSLSRCKGSGIHLGRTQSLQIEAFMGFLGSSYEIRR